MPDFAYSTFKQTITRASQMLDSAIELLDFHKEIEKDKSGTTPTWDLNTYGYLGDLARASLVLGVAALDRYFTDRFTEAVVTIMRREKPTKSLVGALEAAGLTTGVALELLSMSRPFRRIRSLIQSHYSTYVTQSVRKIDDLYETIGLSTFSTHIGRKARRRTLCSAVQAAVQARHRIVHAGDLNRHRRLNPVFEKKIRRHLEQVILFVDTAESIIRQRLT